MHADAAAQCASHATPCSLPRIPWSAPPCARATTRLTPACLRRPGPHPPAPPWNLPGPARPQVSALFLLLCSPRSLADEGRRFGRAFVMAAALATGLHVLNIALQAGRGWGASLMGLGFRI